MGPLGRSGMMRTRAHLGGPGPTCFTESFERGDMMLDRNDQESFGAHDGNRVGLWASLLVLLALVVAGLAGCEGNEAPSKPMAPAEEMFEANPFDSAIEEEVISLSPGEMLERTPDTPPDTDDPTAQRPGVPLPSPGAAPPGAAHGLPVRAP